MSNCSHEMFRDADVIRTSADWLDIEPPEEEDDE